MLIFISGDTYPSCSYRRCCSSSFRREQLKAQPRFHCRDAAPPSAISIAQTRPVGAIPSSSPAVHAVKPSMPPRFQLKPPALLLPFPNLNTASPIDFQQRRKLPLPCITTIAKPRPPHLQLTTPPDSLPPPLTSHLRSTSVPRRFPQARAHLCCRQPPSRRFQIRR